MLLETKYYVCGHTANGFVNYLVSNLFGVQQIIVLKHPANLVKTKVFTQLINLYQDNEKEIIASPYSNRYIDGVIFPKQCVAVLSDSMVTEEVEPTLTIDLTTFTNDPAKVNDMQYLNEIITASDKAAYRYFAKSLAYHEELEEIYIQEMNFKEADRIADVFIAKLFHHQPKRNGNAIIKKRLFGTNTSDGMVNNLASLIEKIENRVFIKGRAGTGKSVFMKKVLAACIEKGYDVEIYHCSFDPNSIDMVLIRELNYCLFDSTAPHELFPSKKSDQIIDLYERTVTAFTDEKYSIEINDLMKKYKLEMQQGLILLENTRETHKIMDRIWQEVSDVTIKSMCRLINQSIDLK